MNIIYKTHALTSEILNGANLSLSVENEQGTKPTQVSYHCEGTLQEDGNLYINIDGTYDCVNRVFSSINGASLPSGFLPQLEAKITEFYNQLGN